MTSKIKPYEGKEPYVFISYCQQDMALCGSLVNELNARHVRVWFDNAVHIGDMWPEVIANHLKDCRVCILLITNNFVGSVNCNNELAFSTQNHIPAIPLLADGTNVSAGMQMTLAAIKYIKFDPTRPLPVDKLMESPDLKACVDPNWKPPVQPIESVKTGEGTTMGQEGSHVRPMESPKRDVPPEMPPEPPKAGSTLVVNLTQHRAYVGRKKQVFLYRDKEKGLAAGGENKAGAVAEFAAGKDAVSVLNRAGENVYTEKAQLTDGGRADIAGSGVLQIGGQLLWIGTGDLAEATERRGFIGSLYCTGTGEHVCVVEGIILGRNYPWRSGAMDDRFISGKNTQIQAKGAGYVIKDVGDDGSGSVNGTWLNKTLLEAGRAYELKDGDRIQLGETELRFAFIPVEKIQ